MKTSKIFVAILILITSEYSNAGLTRISALGTQPVFQSTMGSLQTSTQTNLVNGSLWADDDYNVFYNPSYAFENRDMFTIQNANEGGFFKTFNETYVFGVYLNRGGSNGLFKKFGAYQTGAQHQYAPGLLGPGIRETAGFGDTAYYTGSGNGTLTSTILPIDLILASDWGIKWGVRLTTAQRPWFSKSTNVNSRYWNASAGIQFLGFEPFISYTGESQIKTTREAVSPQAGTQTLDEFGLGVRFRYEGWSPYVAYKRFVESGTPQLSTRQMKTLMNTIGLGLGHSSEIRPKVTLIKHIGFYWNEVEDGEDQIPVGTMPTIYRGYSQFTIPVNVAIEAEVYEGVTARGSLAYKILNQGDYDNSKPDAQTAKSNLKKIPEVRIGGAYRYREYTFDVTAGTGSTSRNDAKAENGFSTQVFAMAGVTYKLAY